jgi:lipopolysaccharide/colanic/teichoic acid biosynthesis glycosyltransferase
MEACPPDGRPELRIHATRHANRLECWWKRPLDLLLGAVAALALSPLIVCLALLVRLESGSPVFFRQERIGQDGRPFRIWKFRSMYTDSDDHRHRVAASAWFAAQPTNGGYKPDGDPRVTPFGGFLRKTSLDELPQLFNVLSGDMSLVGPRPGIAYELDHYLPWYFERQAVKPGMTGLWQVSGRDRLSADAMMRLDVRYVRERTLWLDLKILTLTLPALMGRIATAE